MLQFFVLLIILFIFQGNLTCREFPHPLQVNEMVRSWIVICIRDYLLVQFQKICKCIHIPLLCYSVILIFYISIFSRFDVSATCSFSNIRFFTSKNYCHLQTCEDGITVYREIFTTILFLPRYFL